MTSSLHGTATTGDQKPLTPCDFDLAIDALCRPRSRQANKMLDLNLASRNRPGPVAMLINARDKLWAEIDILHHKISGINLAIEILSKGAVSDHQSDASTGDSG